MRARTLQSETKAAHLHAPLTACNRTHTYTPALGCFSLYLSACESLQEQISTPELQIDSLRRVCSFMNMQRARKHLCVFWAPGRRNVSVPVSKELMKCTRVWLLRSWWKWKLLAWKKKGFSATQKKIQHPSLSQMSQCHPGVYSSSNQTNYKYTIIFSLFPENNFFHWPQGDFHPPSAVASWNIKQPMRQRHSQLFQPATK